VVHRSRRAASITSSQLAGLVRCVGGSPSPLTERAAFRAPPTSIFNGRLGYRFDNVWRIQLDFLNLFNTKTNQINYAYGSLLTSDSLFKQCFPVQIAPAAVCQVGVMDYILHPAEPLAVRVSLTGVFSAE